MPVSAKLRSYWNETRRPLVCLVFAAPLLVVYEVGVWTFPQAARNGADVWMRGWLGAVGLSGAVVLPAVVVGVLLAWHYTSRQPWRVPRGVLLGMVGESVLVGFALRVFARLFAPVFSLFQLPGDDARIAMAAGPLNRLLQRVIEFIGAGVYEEVLFRLVLLSALIAIFSHQLPRPRAVLLAAVVSSVMFAAAHHVGALGEDFYFSVFLFRLLAGGLFAAIFLYRGFGIAIGAHAVYDVLVGMHGA